MHRVLPFVAASLVTACGSYDSCFVRGTRVSTEHGDHPIEALAIGDVVLSYSHSENAIVPRRIVAVHRSLANEIRTITVVGRDAPANTPGECLEVTPSHPFWVVSRGAYIAARDVQAGDELLLGSGGDIRLGVVRSVDAREVAAPTIEVFNISVESPESNYFAGGVLVHNKELPPNICEDVVVGAISEIAQDSNGLARHRFEVTTPRAATLSAWGFGRRAGAATSEEALSGITVTSADGLRWIVEFVVEEGQEVSVGLSGTSRRSDGSSCVISKIVLELR